MATFIAGVLWNMFFAWILMLLMGALHHEVSTSIPAVNYFGALLIIIVLDFMSLFVRGIKL